MMRKVSYSKRFEKDAKRLQKRGLAMNKLREIVTRLAAGETLEDRYRDHPLHGNYEGFRECHIAPDWLLVYILAEDELALARTGTHSELFE